MKRKTVTDIKAIKAAYAKLLAPIKKERQEKIKAFKKACKHPAKKSRIVGEFKKQEIFYDGYQPRGAPSYYHYRRTVTHCDACESVIKRSKWAKN
jgi:hypothetical protein